jgi:hypothetical protein
MDLPDFVSTEELYTIEKEFTQMQSSGRIENDSREVERQERLITNYDPSKTLQFNSNSRIEESHESALDW